MCMPNLTRLSLCWGHGMIGVTALMPPLPSNHGITRAARCTTSRDGCLSWRNAESIGSPCGGRHAVTGAEMHPGSRRSAEDSKLNIIKQGRNPWILVVGICDGRQNGMDHNSKSPGHISVSPLRC